MNIAKYISEIIILLFIVLGLSMSFNIKYNKNKISKIILNIFISLLTIYLIVVSIDIYRVNSFKTPIFAKASNNAATTSNGTSYKGIGYRINIKYYSNNVIEKIEMYICEKIVAGGVQDIINPEKSNTIIDENISIKLEAEKENITNFKATFVISNKTEDTYIYGEPYFIEYEKNNTWYNMTPINNMDFNDIAYILKSKESKEITINWEYHYGKLKPGKYRIVKYAYRESDNPIKQSEKLYISLEFTIN